jgi:general secretion pathway protein D
MKKIILSCTLALLLTGTGIAASTVGEDSANTVKINFKNLKIVDFINMVAHITGKNILIGQNVQGTVDFVSVKPVRKDKIYDLLVKVLATKGYTIRDTKEGFLHVIRSADAPKSAPPIYGDSDLPEVQTSVIPVENLNVRTILRQVNFLLSKYGKITLSYESNSVVVTDYPENIKTIQNLIRKLDNGTVKPNAQFVRLHNADAKAVLPKAQKLANAMFDSKIQTQKISVFADDASNSIVLIGAQKNVRKLIPKIRKMDKGNETVDKHMEIIYVKNADAAEIVKTLEKLLSDKSFARSRKDEQNQPTFAQTQPNQRNNSKSVKKVPTQPLPLQRTEPLPGVSGKDKPTVTVDTELNAVVVYATDREIKEIRSVVEELDVERQQVYVQAKIVEISKNKAEQLGMKYSLLGGTVNSSGLYGFSGLIGSLDGSDAIGRVTSLLGNNFDIPKVTKALALGTTISLFDKNGVANILSEPAVLCINNKESSLYVGRTESILTQATTGSDATSLTRQNYSREDIGLTLKVKPRISEDNKVALDIKTILEDVIGGQVGLPTTTKREVSTTSIVKNGETVIIGGLVKDKTSKTVTKIPLLGDIPILGNLFKHTKEDKDKISLVIMITPYIVKRSEDLGRLKEALGKLDMIEKNLAFQIDEKLRTGKPIVIEPETITGSEVIEESTPQTVVHDGGSQVVLETEPLDDSMPEITTSSKPEPAPTVSQEPTEEIVIDDHQRAYRVLRDSEGNIISKVRVPYDEYY